jgi:hypothetical protein
MKRVTVLLAGVIAVICSLQATAQSVPPPVTIDLCAPMLTQNAAPAAHRRSWASRSHR